MLVQYEVFGVCPPRRLRYIVEVLTSKLTLHSLNDRLLLTMPYAWDVAHASKNWTRPSECKVMQLNELQVLSNRLKPFSALTPTQFPTTSAECRQFDPECDRFLNSTPHHGVILLTQAVVLW